MDYYKFDFTTGVADNEILIALLSPLPFDTFVEHEKGFTGYLPAKDFSESVEKEIDSLKVIRSFFYEKSYIAGENWNKAWESNFHPILINNFCGIRADFHPPFEAVDHELIITPKMAFGTGHHETTFMVIELMRTIGFSGHKVLDYGCGTGVLAILASKLGAKAVDAIDIEEAAWQNTLENCETNGVQNVIAYKGELPLIGDQSYGIVLANINRNVILDSLNPLSKCILPAGHLIISGILKSDRDQVMEALAANGFECLKSVEKNNWAAMHCRLKQ